MGWLYGRGGQRADEQRPSGVEGDTLAFFYMAINVKISRKRQAPATPLVRFWLDLAGHQL
jgi:hypothetical protein